jgi:hypothetical protein
MYSGARLARLLLHAQTTAGGISGSNIQAKAVLSQGKWQWEFEIILQ